MVSSSNASKSIWLMPLLIICLGLLSLITGDLVPTNNGFGWDGTVYKDLVLNLSLNYSNLSNYYAHRILPSAIIRLSLNFLGLSSSDVNIINLFRIFNLVCLISTCFIWNKISSNFQISKNGRWIGFAALFLNFHIGKGIFFAPVSTDPSALFLSILLLFFYLENKTLSLSLAIFFGSFIWPLTSFFGALLLLFPRPEKISNSHKEFNIVELKTLHLYFVFTFFLGLFLFLLINLEKIDYLLFELSKHLKSGKELRQSFATGIPSIIVICFALSFLIGSKKYLKMTLTTLGGGKKKILLCFIAIILPEIIIRIIICNK